MAPALPVFAGQARSHRNRINFWKLSKAVAPTGKTQTLNTVLYLWEPACRRWGLKG